MPNLLFEILTEELPIKAQSFALDYFKSAYIKHLLNYLNLKAESCQVFTGPRRITVLINNLPGEKLGDLLEIKGPPTTVGEEIVQKFLERNNKTIKDLYTKNIGGKGGYEYYFLSIHKRDQSITEFIKNVTEKILHDCKWPKSMRWGNYYLRWVRPIISMLCLLDEEIIPIQFYHYKASNKTLGNRILSRNCEIIINNIQEYEQKLFQHFVIVSQGRRRSTIIEQIEQIAKSESSNSLKILKIDQEETLLEEVVGLVEWPYAILGKFSQSFLRLPAKLVTRVLKHHQKIFPVYQLTPQPQADHALANYFLVIANFSLEAENSNNNSNNKPNNNSINNSDSNFSNNSNSSNLALITKGYEKVIAARLKDADSLIEHDLKIDLYNSAESLKQIIFHKNLGNLKDKIERVVSLSKFIAVWVPGAPIMKIEKAASLSRADLITSVVKEYPELQGVMGAYYLKIKQEEDQEILHALENYQLPVSAYDEIPRNNPIAITLSIADKIDTLVGLIISAEKIDSAKDPYGLRRYAIGILRVMLESNINLPLKVIVIRAIDLYPSDLFRGLVIEKLKIKAASDERLTKNKAIAIVLEFLLERFRHILIAKGISSKIFDAVTKDLDRPLLVEQKCLAVLQFLRTREGEELISAYKRINNILIKYRESKENKDFPEDIRGRINKKMLLEPEELCLAQAIESITTELDNYLKKNRFSESCALLARLTYPLNNFMNSITVNCEAADVRKNRLMLLAAVAHNFSKIADFSYFF